MADDQIARQGYSYKAGLVLGLTLAEVLLLLVFCLLLAVGAIVGQLNSDLAALKEERDLARAQAAALDWMTAELRKSPKLIEAMQRSKENSSDIDEFWRELVEGYALLKSMETAGLRKANPQEVIAALNKANDITIKVPNLDRTIADARFKKQLFQALGERGISNITPIQLADAAKQAPTGGSSTGHRWPPIISLSEADGYYFESGKAELRADFSSRIETRIIPQLLDLIRQYDVDVIEVVGHTDEQQISPKPSNLDELLFGVIRGTSSIGSLRFADNAGLGIGRAAVVVQALLRDPRISKYRILPLSAGQLIDRDLRLSTGKYSGDVKERRRIEIRLRKADP
ncbi:hypothetical protein PY365_12375 [Roseiarcaceae bacterium H3SJ34-1]|uniref:hypothetical protein n=1 Tax=Terripilifer ovatus TaxID=3032367 RepID=UPI003AB93780|nr:hypothetical protein [Roseiarcaceae bacterium H3SJ34-1]